MKYKYPKIYIMYVMLLFLCGYLLSNVQTAASTKYLLKTNLNNLQAAVLDKDLELKDSTCKVVNFGLEAFLDQISMGMEISEDHIKLIGESTSINQDKSYIILIPKGGESLDSDPIPRRAAAWVKQKLPLFDMTKVEFILDIYAAPEVDCLMDDISLSFIIKDDDLFSIGKQYVKDTPAGESTEILQQNTILAFSFISEDNLPKLNIYKKKQEEEFMSWEDFDILDSHDLDMSFFNPGVGGQKVQIVLNQIEDEVEEEDYLHLGVYVGGEEALNIIVPFASVLEDYKQFNKDKEFDKAPRSYNDFYWGFSAVSRKKTLCDIKIKDFQIYKNKPKYFTVLTDTPNIYTLVNQEVPLLALDKCLKPSLYPLLYVDDVMGQYKIEIKGENGGNSWCALTYTKPLHTYTHVEQLILRHQIYCQKFGEGRITWVWKDSKLHASEQESISLLPLLISNENTPYNYYTLTILEGEFDKVHTIKLASDNYLDGQITVEPKSPTEEEKAKEYGIYTLNQKIPKNRITILNFLALGEDGVTNLVRTPGQLDISITTPSIIINRELDTYAQILSIKADREPSSVIKISFIPPVIGEYTLRSPYLESKIYPKEKIHFTVEEGINSIDSKITLQINNADHPTNFYSELEANGNIKLKIELYNKKNDTMYNYQELQEAGCILTATNKEEGSHIEEEDGSIRAFTMDISHTNESVAFILVSENLDKATKYTLHPKLKCSYEDYFQDINCPSCVITVIPGVAAKSLWEYSSYVSHNPQWKTVEGGDRISKDGIILLRLSLIDDYHNIIHDTCDMGDDNTTATLNDVNETLILSFNKTILACQVYIWYNELALIPLPLLQDLTIQVKVGDDAPYKLENIQFQSKEGLPNQWGEVATVAVVKNTGEDVGAGAFNDTDQPKAGASYYIKLELKDSNGNIINYNKDKREFKLTPATPPAEDPDLVIGGNSIIWVFFHIKAEGETYNLTLTDHPSPILELQASIIKDPDTLDTDLVITGTECFYADTELKSFDVLHIKRGLLFTLVCFLKNKESETIIPQPTITASIQHESKSHIFTTIQLQVTSLPSHTIIQPKPDDPSFKSLPAMNGYNIHLSCCGCDPPQFKLLPLVIKSVTIEDSEEVTNSKDIDAENTLGILESSGENCVEDEYCMKPLTIRGDGGGARILNVDSDISTAITIEGGNGDEIILIPTAKLGYVLAFLKLTATLSNKYNFTVSGTTKEHIISVIPNISTHKKVTLDVDPADTENTILNLTFTNSLTNPEAVDLFTIINGYERTLNHNSIDHTWELQLHKSDKLPISNLNLYIRTEKEIYQLITDAKEIISFTLINSTKSTTVDNSKTIILPTETPMLSDATLTLYIIILNELSQCMSSSIAITNVKLIGTTSTINVTSTNILDDSLCTKKYNVSIKGVANNSGLYDSMNYTYGSEALGPLINMGIRVHGSLIDYTVSRNALANQTTSSRNCSTDIEEVKFVLRDTIKNPSSRSQNAYISADLALQVTNISTNTTTCGENLPTEYYDYHLHKPLTMDGEYTIEYRFLKPFNIHNPLAHTLSTEANIQISEYYSPCIHIDKEEILLKHIQINNITAKNCHPDHISVYSDREDEILIKREELIYLGCRDIYGNSVNLTHTNTNTTTKYKMLIRSTDTSLLNEDYCLEATLEITPNIIKEYNYKLSENTPGAQEHVGESVFKLGSQINNKPGKHIISLFIDGVVSQIYKEIIIQDSICQPIPSTTTVQQEGETEAEGEVQTLTTFNETWKCTNGTCVSGGYINCANNLAYKSCLDNLEFAFCETNTLQCAKTSSNECGCDEGMVKIGYSSCFNESDVKEYIPPDLSINCANGSDWANICQIGDLDQSIRVCPWNYDMCINQACVPNKDVDCDFYTNCVEEDSKRCIEAANPKQNKVYRCWDMSLVSHFLDCPSVIKCPLNMVVCPDGSCRANEYMCKEPRLCKSDQILCPIGVCAPNIEECPRYPSCGNYRFLSPMMACGKTYAGYDTQPSTEEGEATASTRIIRRTSNTKGSTGRHRRNLITTTKTILPFIAVDCPKGKIRCPDASCKKSYEDCATPINCGSLIKCEDNSCKARISDCPVYDCPSNLAKCWEGSCVDDYSKCPSGITCTSTFPVLCPDLTCRSSVKECPKDVECPIWAPFRCGNGECRDTPLNCPSLSKCPNKYLKCEDSACVKGPAQCLTKNIHCEEPGYINCPADGKCAKSRSLCPTHITCPATYVKSWNGLCVKEKSDYLTSTNVLKCSDPFPVRCHEGSCRANKADCPTEILCPVTKPIKCWEGSCRESLSNCPGYESCPPGFLRCADGSCVKDASQCGTGVTCTTESPIKCYDNTCKKDPRDCPSIPDCSVEKPFLCMDGICQKSSLYCSPRSKCPEETPVKCPDLSCAKGVDECSHVSGCPGGLFLCPDGSCKAESEYCPDRTCPYSLPYLCTDGMCAYSQHTCNSNSTGCPSYIPYKCDNGECVFNSSFCRLVQTVTETGNKCPTFMIGKSCADGSCHISQEMCPSIFGCPKDAPFKCFDGKCVDLTQKVCREATCPGSANIKCDDGQCVQTKSQCSTPPELFYTVCTDKMTEIKKSDESIGQLLPCADGSCAQRVEQCRPLHDCASSYVRCSDGSCRMAIEFCPLIDQNIVSETQTEQTKTSTCPEGYPILCSNGACAATQNDCGKQKRGGCTAHKCGDPKFPGSLGMCTESPSECESVSNQPIYGGSGCKLNMVKCFDGVCVESIEQCLLSNGCPSITPYVCGNGACEKSMESCLENSGCSGMYTCPDGRCAQDWINCTTTKGCPISTPFKCGGTDIGEIGKGCAVYPFVPMENTLAVERACTPLSVCPEESPYLCSDGGCQGDPLYCVPKEPCQTGEKLCPNGKCVPEENLSLCHSNTKIKRCPLGAPILCPSGHCVENTRKCLVIANAHCTPDTPHVCASGLCVKYYYECIPLAWRITYKITISSTPTPSRILGEGEVEGETTETETETETESESETETPTIAPLPENEDKRCIIKGYGFLCPDGSCAKDAYACLVIIDGCNNPSKPYRCAGSCCSYDLLGCPADCPGTTQQCQDGFSSVDGICRSDMLLLYNGCPTHKPLQCPNGYCAEYKSKCAGISDCPLDRPFKCFDALCVRKFSDCKRAPRSYKGITVTINPIQNQIIDLIYDDQGVVIAKIHVPSNTLGYDEDTNDADSQVIFSSVPDSRLRSFADNFEPAQKAKVKQQFQYGFADLDPLLFILSPAIHIRTSNEADYLTNHVALELWTSDAGNLNLTEDTCLGRVTDESYIWECYKNQMLTMNNERLVYTTNQTGIYAIIYMPTTEEEKSYKKCREWQCEETREFILAILGSLLVFLIIVFSLWCVAVSMEQYKQAERDTNMYQRELEEIVPLNPQGEMQPLTGGIGSVAALATGLANMGMRYNEQEGDDGEERKSDLDDAQDAEE